LLRTTPHKTLAFSWPLGHIAGMPDDFRKRRQHLQRLLREALTLTKSLPPPEGAAQEAATSYDTDTSRYRIARYGDRSWAAYEGDELIAVTAYKKGALAIVGRLQSLERQLAELHQRLADQAASAQQAPPERQEHPQSSPLTFQERLHRPAEQLPLIEMHPRYRAINRPSSARGR
jgi:hypothetical protein